MSIADYKPQTAEVAFKGGSFLVRGLALEDVSVLLRSHLPDLNALVTLFQSNARDDVAVTSMAQYAIALVKEAPGLVSNLIALAADEPDNVAAFRKLSMPIQLRAIETIGRLTFEESGGPKNFFESLINLVRSVSPTAGQTGSLI